MEHTSPNTTNQGSPTTVSSPSADRPLLDVRNLTTVFHTSRGTITAVDDVSFSLRHGRTLCLVGESGCGKSVTALSLMRLLTPPVGETVEGRVLLDGNDLLALPESAMRRVRGNDISMIFQEPMTSLNPVFRVGDQIAEAIRLHRSLSRRTAWTEAVSLLRKVGIPSPEQRARDFPHQMSGGMRQRVMIAMALACSPRLIIADEPTTALDVTIQGQILDLMSDLSRQHGAALLLITHDLGVVAQTADDVAVMYAGRIVEQAAVADIFATPLHPYTQGLLRSIPRLPAAERSARAGADSISPFRPKDGQHAAPPDHTNVSGWSGAANAAPLRAAKRGQPLPTIPGMVPPLYALPSGCTFSDRCEHVFARCRTETPPLLFPPSQSVTKHGVRCWLHA